ncbi:Copper chaperone CopZ [compost metagenome]
MQVFTVQGMSCGHCVRAVTAAVKRHDSAASVDVDLSKGEVRVESTLNAQQIIGLINEEGYAAKAL